MRFVVNSQYENALQLVHAEQRKTGNQRTLPKKMVETGRQADRGTGVEGRKGIGEGEGMCIDRHRVAQADRTEEMGQKKGERQKASSLFSAYV